MLFGSLSLRQTSFYLLHDFTYSHQNMILLCSFHLQIYHGFMGFWFFWTAVRGLSQLGATAMLGGSNFNNVSHISAQPIASPASLVIFASLDVFGEVPYRLTVGRRREPH